MSKLKSKKGHVEKYKFLIDASTILLDDFRVIPFYVKDYDKAFEYFEVLNDRGLDVSALDLIKNRCLKISDISTENRLDIFTYWSRVFSDTLIITTAKYSL